MKIVRLIAIILGVAVATTAFASTPRLLTPQDLWALKRIGSPALSPDGQRVVFTIAEWSVEKNKSTSNLWLAEVATGSLRRLTTMAVSDSSPAWSPDGTRIAFTSKRGEDETAALYVLPLTGGEAEKILELPYGVATPRWLPDGSALVVATRVLPALAGRLGREDLAAMKKEMKRRKDSKMTARVTEARAYRYWDTWTTEGLAHRLVRVDLATKGLVDLLPGTEFGHPFTNAGVLDFEIAPDGRSVALTINSTPPPYSGYLNNDIYVVPTDGSGVTRNLTPENPGDDSSATFSPDGRSLYFKRLETPYYNGEFAKLWRHDLATGTNVPVTDQLDYSVGDVAFSADGQTLWITSEDKGATGIFRLKADGSDFSLVHRAGTSSGLVAEAGTLVFANNTTSRPDELFVLDPVAGTARPLTQINAALLAELDLGKVEEYWFEGAAGAQVQGWLIYPPGFDAKKSYPLLQLMHGGPHTMVGDSWSYRWNAHAMAAPGYVVTWVNRHGSTGFGEKFSQSILGQWGDKPLDDILRSTDFLLKKLPNLDPKRMAAAGGSYGGYMAAWVAGHTDRFAALINHAGVNDFITQYGADVTSFGFSQVLGGKPWENVEGMQRNNPTTYAKNFKTPMLIIHGEKDYRVPYVNGTALYGIYQAMGLPARLVIFPDENHWVLTPQNSIYWNWEFQTWLARWIGGTPTLTEPRFEAKAE
ncbi:Prolyl tripeptidyl peptidase precursor [Lacunisphaera limnophila]|uniref:Prolyl tripeptidyl peptidase n=1 Tax=Lacunisphaera limnophila TaxID=1838286 RepID=A0A1D8AT22_9BACT|nr:S9 family peptidase [Lacunisphaera limnophila]AOS44012.1 Prolyl tripeptidyl peptidase precursor [Lacunisphaera limnophila]